MLLKLSFLTSLLCFSFLTNAQEPKNINTTDLVVECTKYGGVLPSKQMVLWIPPDFWTIIGVQMKLSAAATNSIKEEMSNYMMFAVVDYTLTQTGAVNFKSEEEVRTTIVFMDSSKLQYLPLRVEDVSNGAMQIVENLKPVLERLLGQFGEGMRLIIFDAPKIGGKHGFDLTKRNHFTLSWASTSLKWKLPFYSVLPPKYCSVDKEEMKGNWDFCPEHGIPLTSK